MRLLPHILAVLEFPKVGLEPLRRNVDVGALDGAFNVSPEGFDGVGVNLPGNVLPGGMID